MDNYNRIKEDKFGTYYYLNNIQHRLDGPAIEYFNGTKFWRQNGLLHRMNGPAVEYFDGYKAWYYEGKHIECSSQEEFERLIKLKLFW